VSHLEFDKNANSTDETSLHKEFVLVLYNFVWRQIGVCVFWALTSVGAFFVLYDIEGDEYEQFD